MTWLFEVCSEEAGLRGDSPAGGGNVGTGEQFRTEDLQRAEEEEGIGTGPITRVEAKFKLGQNRGKEDREKMRRALEASGEAEAIRLARLMSQD